MKYKYKHRPTDAVVSAWQLKEGADLKELWGKPFGVSSAHLVVKSPGYACLELTLRGNRKMTITEGDWLVVAGGEGYVRSCSDRDFKSNYSKWQGESIVLEDYETNHVGYQTNVKAWQFKADVEWNLETEKTCFPEVQKAEVRAGKLLLHVPAHSGTAAVAVKDGEWVAVSAAATTYGWPDASFKLVYSKPTAKEPSLSLEAVREFREVAAKYAAKGLKLTSVEFEWQESVASVTINTKGLT